MAAIREFRAGEGAKDYCIELSEAVPFLALVTVNFSLRPATIRPAAGARLETQIEWRCGSGAA
jgi:hypothetical protein